MRLSHYALTLAVATTCLIAPACSNSSSSADTTTTTPTSAAVTSSSKTPPSNGALQSLLPTPANTQRTDGPDAIGDSGIHLHFVVNGSPAEVVEAYKTALEDKGWAVTTIVSSGGGGGGGATYTGTHGDSYGVFDGGGYGDTTYFSVCAWPSKPANPNCSRAN